MSRNRHFARLKKPEFGLGLSLGPGLGSDQRRLTYDIYVDNINGSDNNNGQTASTAFQTLAAAQAAALAIGNGARIALAYGSHWREALLLSSLNSVKIHGYGDTRLPLPKIDCSNVASNASFTLASGQTKTYQITWTHSIQNDYTKRKLRAWENGVRLKWVSSISNCEAQAGSFYVATGSIANPATIYVHPNGDTNPATDGKIYEITAREQAVVVGPGRDVRHIHTTRNAHHDGSFIGGGNGYAYGVLSTDGVVHNQWHSPGSTSEYCVAYDAEPSTWRTLGATLFVTYSTTSAGSTTYRRCFAYSPAAATEAHSGFYAHTAGGSEVLAQISIEDCAFYGPSEAAAASNTLIYKVDGLFAEWPLGRATGGHGIGCVTATANLISNVTAINPARLLGYTSNLTARDVRAYIAEGFSGGLVMQSSSQDIQYCTFIFAAPIATANSLVFNPTADADVFKNNVIENGGYYILRSDGSIDSNFNVFYYTKAITDSFFVVSSASYNFTGWKTATGGDGNSVQLSSQPSSIVVDAANADFGFTSVVVDQGGRASGSRKAIPRPDWTTLVVAWQAGYLGIDGTGP